MSIKPIDGLNEVERKARSKEDEKIQNKFQVFNKKLGRLWCYLPQWGQKGEKMDLVESCKSFCHVIFEPHIESSSLAQ